MDELSVHHSRLGYLEALLLVFMLDLNGATNQLNQLLQVPIHSENLIGAL
jgi:hypothetical protein